MMAHAARLLTLAIFSGLAVNFILQLGFGLMNVAHPIPLGKKMFTAALGIQFVTVLLLWLLFSFIRFVIPLGFYEFILIFPVSYLVFIVIEYLAGRFVFGKYFRRADAKLSGGILSGGVPESAALFITLNTAGNFSEAAVLCAGFVLGIALAVSVTTEIRKRSEMEAVPLFLRGGPLVLIAMGLLSLVFTSSAVMLFDVLGAK